MKKCIYNANRPCSDFKKNEITRVNVTEACDLMRKEMEKIDRRHNITLLKTWLNFTRCSRNRETSKCTAKEILEKYPALKKDILVSSN